MESMRDELEEEEEDDDDNDDEEEDEDRESFANEEIVERVV